MVKCCMDPNCCYKYGDEPKKSLHRFPRDETRSQHWVEATAVEEFVPTLNSYLCEDHFQLSDFFISGGKKTKAECSSQLISFPRKERQNNFSNDL